MLVPILLVVLAGLAIRALVTRARMPPGPNPIPLLGNLSFPKPFCDNFKRFSDQYGDVMTFRVLGSPALFVNTRRGAAELLEKRTAVTGARPHQVMCDELVEMAEDHSRTNDLALHRQYRRLFASVLGPRTVLAQGPIQLRETRRAALEVLENPDGYQEYLHRTVAAISFGISYGRKINTIDDPMIARGVQTIKMVADVISPGSYLVDMIPALKYLPDWFPCAGFKKRGEEYKALVRGTRDEAFDEIKDAIAAGKAKPCLGTTLLQDKAEKYDEALCRWTLWSLFTGGADTSTGAILSFLAAMVTWPDVQHKAHAELDRVVGRERLPGLEDKDDLPYCTAIVSEVLRWRPPSIIALPHCMSEDEIYNGYVLPKGTLVFPNIWAMVRDERDFPNADEFVPERWLTEDGKLRSDPPGRSIPLTFGFGRRICPGIHLAENNVFAAVIAFLWATEFSIPAGERIDWVEGMGLQQPHKFKLEAKPRFEGTMDLLRTTMAEQ